MILWFLRCFSAYKDLEAAYEMTVRNYEKEYSERCCLEATLSLVTAERDSLKTDLVFVRAAHAELKTENLRLQDRLESAVEDRAKLWSLVEEAQAGERKAYQMQINEEWQKRYGVTPHPDAPAIPENQQHSDEKLGSFGRRRVIPSEAVAKATLDYWVSKAKAPVE